ncbi:MAG: hypothetical protein Q9218_008302, partial [Villophora microphyllina]
IYEYTGGVVLRLLNNIDNICDIICKNGPQQDDALDSFAKIQETAHEIVVSTEGADEPARMKSLEAVEITEGWNDDDDDATLEVNDEPQSMESPSIDAAAGNATKKTNQQYLCLKKVTVELGLRSRSKSGMSLPATSFATYPSIITQSV